MAAASVFGAAAGAGPGPAAGGGAEAAGAGGGAAGVWPIATAPAAVVSTATQRPARIFPDGRARI